jgi:mRNA deadenylase 3'-5' endonuclease subunit Ccr4
VSTNPNGCYASIVGQVKRILHETEDFLQKYYEDTKDNEIKIAYDTIKEVDRINPTIAMGLIDMLSMLHVKSLQKHDQELFAKLNDALAILQLYLVITLALADTELRKTIKCIMDMDDIIAEQIPYITVSFETSNKTEQKNDMN